jgi:hypothetical protein
MERRASDRTLTGLLRTAEEEHRKQNVSPEEHSELHRWLKESHYHEQHVAKLRSASWAAFSRDGIMLDRVPERTETVGDTWYHRDYFHGRGEDLSREKAADLFDQGNLAPIRHPHMSAIYRSRSDNLLKVGFSVPVPKGSPANVSQSIPPRGQAPAADFILATSVAFSTFDCLDQKGGHWSKDRFAVLVKTKRQRLTVTRDNGEEVADRKGIIVHHPKFMSAAWQGGLVTLGEGEYDAISEMSKMLVLQQTSTSMVDNSTDAIMPLLREYEDPLYRNDRWTAAFFPVMIPSAKGSTSLEDTGFVILVQERIE